MKRKINIMLMMLFAFVLGLQFATASPPEKSESATKKKATVVVKHDKDTVNIVITPASGYKWNKLYPSTVKFSVCSDVECVTLTEKLTGQK